MEASKEQSQRLLDEPPPSKDVHSEENAIAVKDITPRKHEIDKKNLDYVLRSGLAGGLAGCAVCHMLMISRTCRR